jgi:hypothetical protein
LSQKRIFKANSWLVPSSNNEEAKAYVLKKEQTDNFDSELNKIEKKFSPSHFLIPGWSGDGIISKDAMGLKNNLQSLVISAATQITNISSNKSLKKSIYLEFLAYAEEHNLHLEDLDSPANFWYHLQRESSPHNSILTKFNEIYCFRAVTVYIFKIRFILLLNKELGNKVTETSIMNPNSFLHKLFRKGSSRELHADCLQVNEYSWYRPGSEDKELIRQLMNQLTNVSVTEIIKICSQDSHSFRDKSKLDFKDSEYSHSLSHKTFGLFINKLLVELPFWLEGRPAERNNKNQLSVLNTKFMGEGLTSLSLSHCLAQEYSSQQKWSRIISPDFQGDKFNSGNFLKYCHELQFITFLVQLAPKQGYQPLDLLCHVMTQKHTKMLQRADQMLMFMDQSDCNNSQYDRVVLNLNNLPKKNPHHALCSAIHSEYSNISKNGFLYVMSNQKFFVPSQSEKIESLLKKFDLKASINLDHLHGRGEICSNVYVFKKKEALEKADFDMNAVLMGPAISKVKKASCLSFNWAGKLSQFNNFEILINELTKVFSERQMASTPIYQKELEHGLSIEFHQDAIVNGKLLSSVSQDSTQITHPNFFKNLTKSCMPLSNYFQLESISDSSPNKSSFTSDFLGITNELVQGYPLILVVDHRSETQTRLIMASSDTYQGMVEKYGHAYYQYFGLTPKIDNINFNIFREFFGTAIGMQLIQLSLGGGSVKMKAKLSSLLIPKFFANAIALPSHLESQLDFLNTQCMQLMTLHPDQIRKRFDHVKENFLNFCSKYPWQCLSRLSIFKFNVDNCLKDFAYCQKEGKLIVDFRNPLIKDPLLNLKSYSLVPKHNDVYIEFIGTTKEDIHLNLTKINLKVDDKDQYCLELYSRNKLIVNLYSEKNLLEFMKFILTQFQNVSISEIIQNFQVPQLKEFNEVIDSYTLLQTMLEVVSANSRQLITDLMAQQISSSAKF